MATTKIKGGDMEVVGMLTSPLEGLQLTLEKDDKGKYTVVLSTLPEGEKEEPKKLKSMTYKG